MAKQREDRSHVPDEDTGHLPFPADPEDDEGTAPTHPSLVRVRSRSAPPGTDRRDRTVRGPQGGDLMAAQGSGRATAEADIPPDAESAVTTPPAREPGDEDVPPDPTQVEFSRGLPAVRVPLWALSALNNPYQALVLAQVLYWFGRDRRGVPRVRRRDGEGNHWLAKSLEDLAGEVGLKPRTVRKAVGELAAAGYLEVRPGLFRGVRMNHYRPGREAIRAASLERTRLRDVRPPGGQ